MTVGEFYLQVIKLVFEDRLNGYFLDRFDTSLKFRFSDNSDFGFIGMDDSKVLLRFFSLNNYLGRCFHLTSEVSFFKYEFISLPLNLIDISSTSYSYLKDSRKALYSIDYIANKTTEQQIEDFLHFFLGSLGLREDYEEYEKKERDALLGEEVF